MERFTTEISKLYFSLTFFLKSNECTVPFWPSFLNSKFYCRPDHPNRHDRIELNEILRSLESNGCWPPYTSDPHPHQPLVNDNVENGIENANSDIYIPRAGTSHEVVTEQPQSSTESLNLPPPMKKGKTKRKKSQKLEVEDPYDPKHVAIADNSKFSITESGDEIDPKNDSKEKVGNNPFDSENGDEIDLKDNSSKNQNPFDSENDEGKEGDFYMDNWNYYTDNDITHCAEEILNKIAMQNH